MTKNENQKNIKTSKQRRGNLTKNIDNVIGLRLREIRLRENHSTSEIAELMGCTQSKVSKIENGILRPNTDYVISYADKLGLSEFEKGEMGLLVRLFSDDFGNLNLANADNLSRLLQKGTEIYRWSKQIRVFVWTGIPSLLHTPAYARSLFRAASGLDDIDTNKIEKEIEERHKLLEDKSKFFSFIISENALRLNYCNDEIMGEQYEWLKRLIAYDNIKIRILPVTARLEAVPFTNFYVFDKKLVCIFLRHGLVKIWNRDQIQDYLDDFRDFETPCITAKEELNRFLDGLLKDHIRICKKEKA